MPSDPLKRKLSLADARGQRFPIEKRITEVGQAALVRPIAHTPGPRDLTKRTHHD